MKIALIHDHITQYGGAERVLYSLSRIFPKAPIYTIVSNPKIVKATFSDRKIINSPLQKIPFGLKKYEWFMPMMPFLFEQFSLSEYDVVISSCSVFAKGVITQPETLHISYCYTPPRFLWHYTNEYIDNISQTGLLRKFLPKFVIGHSLKKIRIWDYLAAQRVDKFIAISGHISKRIQKYYKRSSAIIYPPVEINKFKPSKKENFFLIGGRLVSHKKFLVAIEAFKNLKNQNLIIFGTGPQEKIIRKTIKPYPNIKFIGPISEAKKIELFSKARAFLYPQIEDFGITAVESLASGTPVIGIKKGGLLETVKDRSIGLLYEDDSPRGLINAIKKFEKMKLDPSTLIKSAENFHTDIFTQNIKKIVKEEYKKHKERFNTGSKDKLK